MHFLDVDKHLARGALLHILLQLVDLRTFAPDDDAWPGRADDNAQLVAGALNLNGAHARRLELLLQFLLELYIFQEQLVVVTLDKPARPPRLGIPKAKSVWMDLLSHISSSLLAEAQPVAPPAIETLFGHCLLTARHF